MTQGDHEDTSGAGLPGGLTLRRRDEAVETVTSRALEARLLLSCQGIEVHRSTIAAGERLFLLPSGEVVEFYLLLEGRLRCDLPGGPLFLGPGDQLKSEALEREAIFSAVERTTFLYVSSRPTFHEISERLRVLMELAVEIEVKDGYTADHCRRLQKFSYATGRVLGLEARRLYLLDYGSYLHDVGKIKVPLEILRKPAPLDASEWRIVRRHPVYGREMLDDTVIHEAGPIVEQHHERLDGSGYPHGLAADEILPEAAIVAVSDAYDALTTRRPYRGPVGHDEAMAEIRRYVGVHYPRAVVDAFAEGVRRLRAQNG